MNKDSCRILPLLAAASLAVGGAAVAAPIEFVFESVASGTLTTGLDGDGLPIDVEIVDQHFIITAYGDTDNWMSSGGVYTIFNDSANILFPDLDGGTFLTINDLTTVNVNHVNGVATFGNDDKKQDTVVLFGVPELQTWDRLSSLGLVQVTDGYVETPFGHETSGGPLDLDGDFDATISFQPTVVPEPGALALLSAGGLMLLSRRRRHDA